MCRLFYWRYTTPPCQTYKRTRWRIFHQDAHSGRHHHWSRAVIQPMLSAFSKGIVLHRFLLYHSRSMTMQGYGTQTKTNWRTRYSALPVAECAILFVVFTPSPFVSFFLRLSRSLYLFLSVSLSSCSPPPPPPLSLTLPPSLSLSPISLSLSLSLSLFPVPVWTFFCTFPGNTLWGTNLFAFQIIHSNSSETTKIIFQTIINIF